MVQPFRYVAIRPAGFFKIYLYILGNQSVLNFVKHFINQLEQYFNHDRWGYIKKPLVWGGGVVVH